MNGNLRALLQRHSHSITIDTTHEETEETSHSKKLLVGDTVDCSDLEKTKDDHVGNHGPLSSPFVTSKTEDGGTDGTEEEGKGDGGGDIGLLAIQLAVGTI